MKFLIDAQLPRRLATQLENHGHDVRHTLDLPAGNRTSDAEINRLSIEEERIVVTKDADFTNSFILQGVPEKLLLIATGNIGNPDLLALFEYHLSALESAFTHSRFVELTTADILIHA